MVVDDCVGFLGSCGWLWVVVNGCRWFFGWLWVVVGGCG